VHGTTGVQCSAEPAGTNHSIAELIRQILRQAQVKLTNLGRSYKLEECARSCARRPARFCSKSSGGANVLVHVVESFLGSKAVLRWSRNSPHFMETEGSSARLQEPTTCPYTESDQCSPCPQTSLPLIIIYYIIL